MGELMEDLAQTALDSALKHGAEFVDIRVEDTKITFIEITDGTSKRSSSGQLKGAGVRAFLNGAWAFAHTTNLTQSGMRDIGIRVARTAKVTCEHVRDQFELKGNSHHGKVKLKVKRPLEDVSISEKMSYVKKMDRQIRDYDSSPQLAGRNRPVHRIHPARILCEQRASQCRADENCIDRRECELH